MALILKLLNQYQCMTPQKKILWEKVAHQPILIQHILLHITQICNDARFVPEAIAIRDPSLLPLALVLCTEWVVPLNPAVLENVATVILGTSGSSTTSHTKTLEINLLSAVEGGS